MSGAQSTSGLPMVTQNYSITATGAAALAFSALSFVPRYYRIFNTSAADTIWCSRSGTAAINGAGSFPLAPGNFELYCAPQIIPTNALSIISTGASTPVTIEVG